MNVQLPEIVLLAEDSALISLFADVNVREGMK